MRRFLGKAVVCLTVIASSGAVATVAAPAASAAVNCPPDIVNTTVNDSVVVPAGATCVIFNSTVAGNVVVGARASITLVGATVRGNFVSNGAQDIRIGDCGEFGCAVPRPTVISGNVSITGTTGVPSFPTRNVICDVTFAGGNVVLRNNSAPFVIGTDSQCNFGSGARFRGSLALYDNTAPITLRDVQTSGFLQCSGNAPAPVNGGGNTALAKFGQCAGF